MKRLRTFPFLGRGLPYLYLTLLIIAVYYKALSFGFSYLDDHLLIIDNFEFLRHAKNILQAFGRDVFYPTPNPFVFYRPLLTLSFMLDAHLFGLLPAGYHLTNIGIHIAASCLLFLLLVRLGYARGASFFMASVFAVHPALSQAVAWIPGRNDSLLAVFVIASFIAFIDFAKTGRRLYGIAHVLLFLAAICTKESAIAILPLIGLYYFMIARKRGMPARMRTLVLGWAVVLVLWFLLRQNILRVAIPWTLFDATRSLALQVPGLVQYVGKIFFPVGLSVTPIVRDTPLAPGCIAIALIAITLLAVRRKRPAYLVFGAAWFVVFLAPSLVSLNSGVVISDFMEHRLYVPMAGFMVVMLECIPERFARSMVVTVFLCAGLVLAYAAVTWIHIDNFKDRISFWESAVATSPHSSTAHRFLGIMYRWDGRSDDAERELRRSLALDPQEPAAHFQLGNIYLGRNREDDALNEYRKEVMLNPYIDKASVSLGLLYYKQGKHELAVKAWKTALEVNPHNVEANKNLAIFYCDRKEAGSARYYTDRLRSAGVAVPRDFLDKVDALQ